MYYTSHNPQEVTHVDLSKFLDKKCQSFLSIYITTENPNSSSFKINVRSSYDPVLLGWSDSQGSFTWITTASKWILSSPLHSAHMYRHQPEWPGQVSPLFNVLPLNGSLQSARCSEILASCLKCLTPTFPEYASVPSKENWRFYDKL